MEGRLTARSAAAAGEVRPAAAASGEGAACGAATPAFRRAFQASYSAISFCRAFQASYSGIKGGLYVVTAYPY